MKNLKVAIAAMMILWLPCQEPAHAHRAGLRIRAMNSAPAEGSIYVDQVRYFLPKQLLHFTINYDVYQKSASAPPEKPKFILSVQSPIKLDLISTPDRNLGFIADYSDIQGLVTDAKSTELTLADNGCFKGINAEYNDQLAPIVGETVAGMIKIGKAVAKYAAAAPSNAVLYTKLDKALTIEGTIDLDDAMTDQAYNAALIQHIEALQKDAKQQGKHLKQDDLNRIVIGETKKTLLQTDYVQTQGELYAAIFPKRYQPAIDYELNSILVTTRAAAVSNGFSDAIIPKLHLFLTLVPTTSHDGQAAELLKATKADHDKRGYQMVVTRAPETVEFVVVSNVQMNADLSGYIDSPSCDLDKVAQLAQTGGFNAFEIRRHMFTDASYKLGCNEAGAVIETNSTRTSTLKSIADAFKTITDAL